MVNVTTSLTTFDVTMSLTTFDVTTSLTTFIRSTEQYEYLNKISHEANVTEIQKNFEIMFPSTNYTVV